MFLPEGMLVYLIMIMVSLERAGESMLAVCAAHVAHNKINNHPRKWIRRTLHGPTGLQVEEFGHSDRPAAHGAAYCCFCCHRINHYISRSKLVEVQKAHWHEVVSQQLLLLSTTAATPYTTFFFSSQWASTGGDLHWQQVYGHSAGGHVHAGFFLNKSSMVLINLYMHKSS